MAVVLPKIYEEKETIELKVDIDQNRVMVRKLSEWD